MMTPYEIFMEAFEFAPIKNGFTRRFEFATNQASLIYGDTIALKCVREFFQKHQLKDLIK